MVDPLDLAIKLVGKIKKVVWKVKENRKDCGKLAEVVDTLSADLSWLQLQGSPMEDPRVSASMMRLKVTLESTEKNVVQITGASAVAQGFKADDIAEELDRARQDILMKAIWATFLAVRNSNSKLDQLVEGHAVVLPAILRTGQEALQLLGRLSHIRDSTDDAGKENEMEAKQTVGASTAQSKGKSRKESKAPSASLPPARLKDYTWSALEAAIASKEAKDIIGGGGSNSVHKQKLHADKGYSCSICKEMASVADEVELENESAVIKEFQWNETVKTRFLHELKIILKLKHENIIGLLGYCYEDNESLVQDGSDVRVDNKRHFCFVSRYMLKGNLVRVIEGGQNIDWPAFLGITQGIAKGIHYLHKRNVLHLDLKPKNILLDAHMIPKIYNFGSATKLISDEVKITRNVNNRIGRLEYIAPELSSNEPKASTKSDVYSFGVILLEAISRMCATSEKGRPRGRNEWVDRLEGSDQLGNLFDSALVREELQTTAAIGCVFIGLMCCERDPADRPSMSEVVDMLDAYSHTRNTNNTNKVPGARSQAKGKEKEQVVEAANCKASSSPSQVTIKVADSKSTPARDKKPKYNILTRDRLLTLLKQERFEIARDLKVPEGVAEFLLQRYDWSFRTVRKKWSDERQAVYKAVGLRSSDQKPKTMKLSTDGFGTCKLCGKELLNRISTGSCEHYYCESCWRDYFSMQLRGPRWICLNMRCPDPSCQAPVVRELVEKMADKADKDLYDRHALRSWYSEKMAYSGRIYWQWCPLDCGRAIEFPDDNDDDLNDGVDVVCDCGHSFCLRCCRKAHQPKSCDTMRAIEEFQAEA